MSYQPAQLKEAFQDDRSSRVATLVEMGALWHVANDARGTTAPSMI